MDENIPTANLVQKDALDTIIQEADVVPGDQSAAKEEES
jgi:hypothetical protein